MPSSGHTPLLQQDVPTLVEDLFARAFDEPGLGDRLVATGVVLAIDLPDLERTVVVDLPMRRVSADDSAVPQARIEIRSADLNRYLHGNLNLTLAIAEGDVRVSGAIARVLAVIGLEMGTLSTLYRSVLITATRMNTTRPGG